MPAQPTTPHAIKIPTPQAIILIRAHNGRISIFGPADIAPGPFGVEAIAAGMVQTYATSDIVIVPLADAMEAFSGKDEAEFNEELYPQPDRPRSGTLRGFPLYATTPPTVKLHPLSGPVVLYYMYGGRWSRRARADSRPPSPHQETP